MTREDTSTLLNAIPGIHVERFRSTLKTRILIASLGTESTLVDHQGSQVRWPFLDTPGAVTAAIATEGDDPTEEGNLPDQGPTATLAEYGRTKPFSKVLVRTSISGTMEAIVDWLGHQGALSIDTIGATTLGAGTTTLDAGAAMTVDFLRQGVQTLTNNGADFHPATPGGRFFCFVGSTEACYDMIGEGTPTWAQAKSRDVEAAFLTPLRDTPATAGVYGAIVKVSQQIDRNTTPTPDDDLNLLMARDSYGTVSLDSDVVNPRVIVTMPEELVSAPARNRGTAAWWLLWADTIIDNNRLVVISSDATGVG